MESECSTCEWWRPIDGYTKSESEMVCLFCYLNGHSRAREEGKCFEYKRRRERARKQVPGTIPKSDSQKMDLIHNMERPNNPFKAGISHDVMQMALQGEFDGLPGTSDLTVAEIAEVLCTTQKSVSNAIFFIKKKTGYIVPHAKMVGGRERKEW